MNKGLDIRGLLKSTYSELCERHDPEEIIFSERVLSEIANDSDYHRTAIGYMGYENAHLFCLDDRKGVGGLGKRCGSYPGRWFNRDILALELEERFLQRVQEREISQEEGIAKLIRFSSYFRNSLVYGRADQLVVNQDGRFGKRMLELLRPEMRTFVIQGPPNIKEYISLSPRAPISIVGPELLYKPKFAGFLADSIERVLSESG